MREPLPHAHARGRGKGVRSSEMAREQPEFREM